MQVIVNALGEACPLPVVKANRALREMREPGELVVYVDNEVAVQNLQRMAAGNHLPCSTEQRGEKEYVVRMQVASAGDGGPLEEPPMCCPQPTGSGLLAAVDTDVMGRGSEELGHTLMKGFLFALSQLPQPPQTILFYNGGAKLTVEGSASLQDLRNLADRGVEILTCGTCLNHYGLTEKLAVGKVTNMYEIVEKLASAGKVIKP